MQADVSRSVPQPTDAQVAEAFEKLMASYEAAAFTAKDRAQATPEGVAAFRHLLRERLLADKPLPTVDEVQGLVELALDFLVYTPGRPPSPYGKGQF